MTNRPVLRHLLLALALVTGLLALTPGTAEAAGTGSLTGTVRDADGPLADVLVSAYVIENGDWSWAGEATSGANGAYAVTQLEPGAYFLQYEDQTGDHPVIYSTGNEDPPESDDSPGVFHVTTTAVAVPTITMPVGPDAELEGLVHTTEGAKIDNVLVQAFPSGAAADSDPVASDITYGGHYDLWVSAGAYRIEFTDLGNRYADHVIGSATAVEDDSVTLDTVVLEAATSFVTATGKVNIPSGIAPGDVIVKLYRFTTTPDRPAFDMFAVDTAAVDADGDYSFARVMPGKRYSVEVSGVPLHSAWLGNQEDPMEADSFVTQANRSLSPITTTARPTARGRVTDSSGNAAGIYVTVRQWNGDFWDWADGEAVTDANGLFHIALPEAGRYTLHFSPDGTTSPGRDVFLDGSTADPVASTDGGAFTVTAAQQVTGKNVTLPNSTRISGTVTSANAPAEGAVVTAYTWDSEFSAWDPAGYSTTDASGNYFMRVNRPGRYTVSFEPPHSSPAASQWLGNLDEMPTTQNGNGTFLPNQGAVNDKDISLPAAPVASGQILSSDGGPIAGARMRSYVWTEDGYWKWYGFAVADQSGHYAVKVAKTGKATFRAAATGHYRSFLGGSTRLPEEPTSANSVVLGSGGVAVPNVTLTARPKTKGSIAGTITAASNGSPVRNAEVIACPDLGGHCLYTDSDASGGYGFVDVLTGPWSIRVWPPNENLFSGGTKVTVEDSKVSTANVALDAPAPLPGNVTVAQGGHTTTSGVPSVYVGTPLTLTAPGPQRTPAPTYTVRLADGEILATGSLVWNAAQQKYVGTISSLSQGGEAKVTIAGLQGGPVSFNLYIDPSGVVVDQYGVPLPGSKATLLASDGQGGNYAVVPDGSDTMSPSNRVNPMTTDSDARFHWDVLDGWYKVRAEHDDCTQGTSPALAVPPIHTDLLVKLECTGRDPNVSAPTVTGNGNVGENLTATPGNWESGLSQRTYQWYSGSDPILGANGLTYTVRAGDVGKQLSVRETATRPSYVTENGSGPTITFAPATAPSSNSVQGAAGVAPTNTVAPRISGTRAAGHTVSVSTGTWNIAGLTFTYQWTRNGVAIPNAQKSTYRLTTADAACSVAVRLTATKPGHGTTTVTSAGVAIAKVTSSTAIRLVASKIKKTKRGQAVMTIRAGGLIPTGRVTVLVDRRLTAYGTLTNAKRGVVRVVLPKLAKGSHTVRATYAGAAQISASRSRTLTLKVTK